MSVEGGPSCPEAYMGPTKLVKRERKLQKKLVKVKAKIAVANAPKAVAPVRDQSPPPRVPTSLFVHATPIEHPGERLKSLFSPAFRPTKTQSVIDRGSVVPSYKKTRCGFTVTFPIGHGFPDFNEILGGENIQWNQYFREAGESRFTCFIATSEAVLDKIEKRLAKSGYQRYFK